MNNINLRTSTNGSTGQTARPTAESPAPLLVDSREAARLLGISERTLWGQTAPRGALPCIKIGRAVRYAVKDLEDYIDGQREKVCK